MNFDNTGSGLAVRRPLNELNANDISAFHDDSTVGMDDREPLSAFRVGDKGGLNGEYFEVPDNVGVGAD